MSAEPIRIDGGLLEAGDRWQLRFVRTLRHPPEKVWSAITEPEQVAAWFPTTIEGERKAGAKLRFTFTDYDGPPSEGEMLVFDPPSRLQFRFGDEEVRFDLRAVGAGTELTFVTTFDELGKAARDGAGWHVCLDTLGYQLDGEPLPWKPEDRWRAVDAAYVAHFGPEASTIGPPADHPWNEDAGDEKPR